MKNNAVVLDPDVIRIPPFDELWERDKTKDKNKAIKEISYIYYMCDYNSPYIIYPEEQRRSAVIEDFIRDKTWKPGPKIEEACDKYVKMNQTHSMRLLTAAKIAADKLSEYFEKIDFTELDDKGKPIYVAKDVASNLGSIGKIVESLDKVEDRVKKEVKVETKIRGGGAEGSYER